MTIKKEKIKIKDISKEESNQKEACKKNKCKHDETKQELEIDINEKTGAGWFFVHDNVTCFLVQENQEGNITQTIHEMEEFPTEQGCLDKITELGLVYDSPPQPLTAKSKKVKNKI